MNRTNIALAVIVVLALYFLSKEHNFAMFFFMLVGAVIGFRLTRGIGRK